MFWEGRWARVSCPGAVSHVGRTLCQQFVQADGNFPHGTGFGSVWEGFPEVSRNLLVAAPMGTGGKTRLEVEVAGELKYPDLYSSGVDIRAHLKSWRK